MKIISDKKYRVTVSIKDIGVSLQTLVAGEELAAMMTTIPSCGYMHSYGDDSATLVPFHNIASIAVELAE